MLYYLCYNEYKEIKDFKERKSYEFGKSISNATNHYTDGHL